MRKQTGFQVSQFSLIVLCTKTPKPLASLWQWVADPQPADPHDFVVSGVGRELDHPQHE